MSDTRRLEPIAPRGDHRSEPIASRVLFFNQLDLRDVDAVLAGSPPPPPRPPSRLAAILPLGFLFLSGAVPQSYPPQALINRDTGRQIAIYVPADQTVRFAKDAPATLRICMGGTCKTAAEWTH